MHTHGHLQSNMQLIRSLFYAVAMSLMVQAHVISVFLTDRSLASPTQPGGPEIPVPVPSKH